eukprot:TRINITY_DN2035_c0_g2_i1.p1 TRINITY_DN2035_c0_g2~~TRINITY_DN2035_c0_g2_i1.p1  ORF type:complete len:572 (-),score=75.19 TRINITY_DN2035_c0_g2_i1:129-1778(-)
MTTLGGGLEGYASEAGSEVNVEVAIPDMRPSKRGGVRFSGVSFASISSTAESFSSMMHLFSSMKHRSTLSDDHIKRDRVSLKFDGMRQQVRDVLDHVMVDAVLGLVIFFNFVIIIVDIDYRAREITTPRWVSASMLVCFAVYCIEWCARFYTDRFEIFSKTSCNLDFTIIVVGIIEYILGWIYDASNSNQTSEMIRMLRMLRLLRLLRVVKLFNALRELRKLMQMMATCAKTLFWSFLLCFILMTIWAAIGVETLDNIVRQVDDEGGFADCERCREAFSSVMAANLTLFQIIMAGDSWGRIAIPTIERYPASLLIFVGSLVTLLFGVLNLVLAVVVDTFAETRKNDMHMLATDLELFENAEKGELGNLFNRIDVDGKGTLSFDDLFDGAKQIEEFRQWLRVLDIDSNDLRNLYDILDQTGRGGVASDEFVTGMYRLKNTEAKTAVRLMKCLVHTIDAKVADIQKDIDSLSSKVEKIGTRQMLNSGAQLRSDDSSDARANEKRSQKHGQRHNVSRLSRASTLSGPASFEDVPDRPMYMSEPTLISALVDL